MEQTAFKVGDRVRFLVRNDGGEFDEPAPQAGEFGNITYMFHSDSFEVSADGYTGKWIYEADEIELTDTAASVPAYNPQTGWITKTEAEARSEFEEGWNAAERENFVSVVDFSKQQAEAEREALVDRVDELKAEIKRLKEWARQVEAARDMLRNQLNAAREELNRVKNERDRDLMAHIDRVSDLVNERDAANHAAEINFAAWQAAETKLKSVIAAIDHEDDHADVVSVIADIVGI